MITKEKRILDIITPYLGGFLNNEVIFKEAMIQNQEIHRPINTILELGVHTGEDINFGGQSTKALYYLYNIIGFKKLYSLDLDPFCINTIKLIQTKFLNNNLSIPKHEFISCNSIEYYPEINFDLIFIDTNHDSSVTLTYCEDKNLCGEGFTFKEIMHYQKMLTQNGRIFLHDTRNFYVPIAYGNNVEGACVRFINENPEWAYIEHNTNKHGLGELIRKDSDIFNHLISFDDKYKNWEQNSFNPIKEKYIMENQR